MQIVTINSIRDGVIATLDSRFPNIPIMGEEIKQGMDQGMELEPPCFFVKLLTHGQTQLLGRRYQRAYSFDIHYFAAGYENRAMHDMAEQLFEHLELIHIGGVKYRGTSMTHEIVDRVLHFFVDYNFHVRRDAPVDPDMRTLEQKGGLQP